MKTPDEKYQSDPEFRNLVDILMATIMRAQYTPSEIREAALYACVRYEMLHVKQHQVRIPSTEK